MEHGARIDADGRHVAVFRTSDRWRGSAHRARLDALCRACAAAEGDAYCPDHDPATVRSDA